MQRLALIAAVALAIAHGVLSTPTITSISLTDTTGTYGAVSPGAIDPRTIVSDPSRTLVAPLIHGGSVLVFTVVGTNLITATSGVVGSGLPLPQLYIVPCINATSTTTCSCILNSFSIPLSPFAPTPATIVPFPAVYGTIATPTAGVYTNPYGVGPPVVAPAPPAAPLPASTLIYTTVAGQFVNSEQYAFGYTFDFFDVPGKICLTNPANPGAPTDTGVLFQVEPNCAQAGTTTCPVLSLAALQALDFASPTQKAEIEAQTTKCVSPQTIPTFTAQCTCYDKLTTTACCIGGGVATTYDTVFYKCCGDGSVVRIGDRCRCPRATLTAGTNISTSCPTAEQFCCLPSKFPELVAPTDIGFCYNPSIHQCCNTGWAYDSGSQQCCSINGVQSLNVPCPCSNNSHCLGGQVGAVANANAVCCQQTAPATNEAVVCTTYGNFPTGTGPYQSQRCPGTCIDLTYQLCCNGVSCSSRFEKCCNATCCNRFVGTCINSHLGNYRSFQPGFGANFLNTFVNPAVSTGINAEPILFQTCSETEQMDPLKAFWLFIFPAALLATTLVTLALSLVFANKAAQRLFSFTERKIIEFSILICILIIPLYFSPLYKYGLFIVLLACWSIIVASLRVRWINTVAIIGYIILLIYLFDPFAGSAFFNLTYFRNHLGTGDFTANGIWHGTKRLYYGMRPPGDDLGRCVRYFDYFLYDQTAVDFRFNNPRIFTFGYCADQYLLALYLFQGFIIIVAFILFVLLLIARVLRFRKISAAPIELEVRTDVM